MRQERVSGFPEKGADLRKSGELRRKSRRTSGEVARTPDPDNPNPLD